MTTLTIYRPPSSGIATINIDEKTIYSKKLMGEHKITSEFVSTSALSAQIGDYITYPASGDSYYINRVPDIEKINNSTFKYRVNFESVLYNLSRKLFISADGLADFAYNGTATDYITNIVASINEIDSGWTVGTVATTSEKTLRFANETCRAALTKVAEAFRLEFSLSAKEISLVALVGTETAYSFSYGKDLGLYKIERQQVNNQNIVTKCYGFGGTRNIPSTYRSRAKRLTFAASGMAASGYLVAAASGLYGTIEGQFTDDTIFPQRTSTLTDVNMVFDSGASSGFNNRTSYIEDSALDFDINDYLIEGLTAKVVFKSGDLEGVECEIWKYNAASGRIYINPSIDADGYANPNYNSGSPVIPNAGDTYTLVDMAMPQSYVDTAETALQAATQTFLDENSVPQVVYGIDIDPKYGASESIDINVGDKVTIVDSDLGINALIRISAIEFPLVDPYQIKAVIADFVPYTLQERIVKAASNNTKDIYAVDLDAEERARLNSLRLHQELAKHNVPMYQGVYAAGTTYYGNPSRRDIVRYDPGGGEVFYITKVNAPSESFSGIAPTNTDYWERFQAEYASLATQLLFAELAYIENLGVRYFEGIPVPTSDLAGSVVNTQANRVAVAEIDTITLTGASGSAQINCAGCTRNATYSSSLADTAQTFATDGDNIAAFAAEGVTLSYNGDDIIFTSAVGVAFDAPASIQNISGDLNGSKYDTQAAATALPRIDTVTLNTGTSGTANILCDGVTKLATFFNSYAETAASFVVDHASSYLSGGVVVTSSGADIIFTSSVAGTDFTGSTTITNVPNSFRGSLQIQGNELWENDEDNDDYGVISINRKGYNAGVTRYRHLYIGNGKNTWIAYFQGQAGGNRIVLNAAAISMPNIPTSDPGGDGIWVDGSGYLRR